MKKTTSIILLLVFCLCLLAGCNVKMQDTMTKVTSVYNKENDSDKISPLPETLDINSLDNCTVAVSLEKGGAYVNDSGKMVMDLTVYSYELYDMADVASLEKGKVIIRRNEEIKIKELEKLDSGLVRINGGEENGGFDLISNDNTVYYEVGLNDMKNYYSIGKVTLPVSDEFEYIDSSDLEAGEKKYFAGDFLNGENIVYNFFKNNTSVVIENGTIIKMNKVYMP